MYQDERGGMRSVIQKKDVGDPTQVRDFPTTI